MFKLFHSITQLSGVSFVNWTCPKSPLHLVFVLSNCCDLISVTTAVFKVQQRGAYTCPVLKVTQSFFYLTAHPRSREFWRPGFLWSNCSMKPSVQVLILCLTLNLVGSTAVETAQDNSVNQAPPVASSSDWGIGAIRDGFETVNGYFDSFLELLGGKNGVCQYRCRYGECPLSFPASFVTGSACLVSSKCKHFRPRPADCSYQSSICCQFWVWAQKGEGENLTNSFWRQSLYILCLFLKLVIQHFAYCSPSTVHTPLAFELILMESPELALCFLFPPRIHGGFYLGPFSSLQPILKYAAFPLRWILVLTQVFMVDKSFTRAAF